MIDLYYAPTPNGWKITIMLEQMKVHYKIILVDLCKGDEFKLEFLVLSLNMRVPLLVDLDGHSSKQVTVFETGAT